MKRGADGVQLVLTFPCTQLFFRTIGLSDEQGPWLTNRQGGKALWKLLCQIPFVALLQQLDMPGFPGFPTSYDLFPCAHDSEELFSAFSLILQLPFLELTSPAPPTFCQIQSQINSIVRKSHSGSALWLNLKPFT